MPMMLLCAGTIRGDDSLVRLAMVLFDPTQQRRAKIEINMRVVVDRARLASGRIRNNRRAIGLIAFGVNAFVPIVEGSRARLFFDDSCPGLLARRSIEVCVNYERGHD